MKQGFGKLSIHLIEKAQEEIKEINRQTLFQMSEIKKKYQERISDNISKIESQFIETNIKSLNNSLSSILLITKNELSNLKNKLVLELITDLNQLINEKINNNYSNYINFLLGNFKKVSEFIDKPPEIIVNLNSKDYKYFKKRFNEIQNIFKNKIILENSEEDFIGGFKISHAKGNLSYDYTFTTMLSKSTSLIEIELSKIFSDFDSEIQIIQQNHEKFIQNQKLHLDEILHKNDRD